MSGAGKRQAGRQDRIGNIRIVRPGLLLALATRPGKIWQFVNRVGFLPSQRVCIEAHGQVDIAVPHYLLCNFRMDTRRRQQASGRMSEAVEITVSSSIVYVVDPSGLQIGP